MKSDHAAIVLETTGSGPTLTYLEDRSASPGTYHEKLQKKKTVRYKNINHQHFQLHLPDQDNHNLWLSEDIIGDTTELLYNTCMNSKIKEQKTGIEDLTTHAGGRISCKKMTVKPYGMQSAGTDI